MPLIDDPKSWILRMFEMETREGRGEFCDVFPSGIKLNQFELEKDEFVYGTYKNSYSFTPRSFCIQADNKSITVPWYTITMCSTEHGDGSKVSKLTLTNGQEVIVKISDMAKGHSGRISQLYHQMIKKWGHKPSFGNKLVPIKQYLESPIDKYSFAPNLEPHPELNELEEILKNIAGRPDVIDVLVNIIEYEGDSPISDSLIILTKSAMSEFESLAESIGANGVIEASESIANQVSMENVNIWVLVWD